MDKRDKEPETDLGIRGTLVYDNEVIADQWGQENSLVNGVCYITNQSSLPQRMSWVKDCN